MTMQLGLNYYAYSKHFFLQDLCLGHFTTFKDETSYS